MPWQSIAVRPAWWFLCFAKSSPTWWAQMFVPGPYKHVSAFGFVPGQKLWVFSEMTARGVELAVVPDGQANSAINAMVAGALVVEWVPPAEPPQTFWPPLNHCVAHVAALVGIKSRALRPERFLRDVLAAGGRILDADADEPTQSQRRPAEPGSGGSRSGEHPVGRRGPRPA